MGYLDCCDAGQTWTTGVKPQGQEASSAGATVVQSLTLGAYVKVCQLGGEELQLPLFLDFDFGPSPPPPQRPAEAS